MVEEKPMDSQIHHIDNSLLLDNSSDALNMVNAINALASHPACHTIKIATGYWDIPGTALVLGRLKEFINPSNPRNINSFIATILFSKPTIIIFLL